MITMHILLIHEIFVTPDEGGGTRHYELAKYLVEMGNKVTVIASDVDYLSGKKRYKRREIREGIEIIYSSTLFSVHKNFIYRALSFLSFSITSFFDALRIKNVDIVWGTSPPLFQAITAMIVAFLKRRPFIYEVRDLWIDFAKELNIVNNSLILNILKIFESLLYKRAKKVIVNSPGFIPFIESKIKKDKIILIPNGVISKDFEVEDKKVIDFRKNLGLNDKFVVMYTGNIGVANDIECIIKSADLLRNYKDIIFLIIGGGIKKSEYVKYVKENNIDNIIFLDSFPKKEMPVVISSADVCMATLKDIPLFRTVYPNKVFDYMASGKPTILSIDGVIREVIEKAEGGIFVPPSDSKKLAEAILFYYNNRDKISIHGKNARNYVKKYFEREKIAKALEIYLKEIIDK
jgi:glycosyltransferase involved in cell wall biosynthesis